MSSSSPPPPLNNPTNHPPPTTPPTRKRSRLPSPPSPPPTPSLDQYLSSSISNLRSELQHLQSQRRIDAIRSSSTISRLERHVASLEQDAEEARALVEEIQASSEEGMERLNRERRKALETVHELERRLRERVGGGGGGGEGMELLRRKNEMMERKMGGMEEEMERLRECLREAEVARMEERLERDRNDGDDPSLHTATAAAGAHPSAILSPAKPSILKELNKTRLELSDAERTVRQLNRRHEDYRSQLTQLTKYRESTHRAEARVHALEVDLKSVRREREVLRILEKRWEGFRRELVDRVPQSFLAEKEEEEVGREEEEDVVGVGSMEEEEKEKGEDGGAISLDENAPPEIATVVRHIRSLTSRLSTLDTKYRRIDAQYDAAQRRVRLLEEKGREYSKQEDMWRNEKTNLEKKLDGVELELMTVKSQERVWKRESSGMRSLLDTYREQEDGRVAAAAKAEATPDRKRTHNRTTPTKQTTNPTTTTPTTPTTITKEDPTISGLQLSLTSAQNEIKILNERITTNLTQNKHLTDQNQTTTDELNRVKTKFSQIREALMSERHKAEVADERAARAESLAGKGAFDAESTRALHLVENPLMMAVREKYETEIGNLRAKLAAAVEGGGGGGGEGDGTTPKRSAVVGTPSPSTLTNLDAQKLHRRLKESFREKIGLFREGVYLITGYKIDMIADTDRPQFKVRSIFAEREEDHLIFQWPKKIAPDGQRWEAPSSLDLLDTELAQVLAKSESFRYMTTFNSLPAFMASVCLELFETQTVGM